MRILLALVLAVSAQAQESAFSRIKVVPRGAGVGSIDFYETRANGSSYTRLAGADAMNANRILTLPNEGAVNSEIVAQLMYRHSDSTPLYMVGYRSRGTEASPTAVAYGDVLYNWSGYAYNGSSFVSGSAMTMYVSQASPLEVSFAWATRDATSYTTRLELGASGNLRPDSVISQDLGASSYPWRDVFTKFLKMRSADGANYYISHKTPNLTASHDLVWPDANAAGALTNDGSGALSWDPSGGVAPPVAWDLDTASDVLTLGSHLSGAAQQLVTRFSRGTTASPTAVSNGDQFLQMTFQYYAGTGYKDAAAIFAYVADATPSNDSYGGRLSFFTSNACTVSCSGGNPADEKFRIDTILTAMESLVPSVNNSLALGGASNEWATTHSRILSSSTTMTLIADGAPEWTVTSARFSPYADAGSSIGSSTLKPDEVWARTFRAKTESGYGVQDHSFFADQNSANLNLYTYGNSGSSTPRGGFHAYTAGGTYTTPIAIGNGARMGVVAMHGFSSGSYNNSASIEGWVNGTVSGSTVPGELRFLTMNTSGTLANRWLISPDGTFLPGATNTYDIGASGTRVKKIYTTDFDVSGTCTGCGSTTPPVTWDLDTSGAVATLGNHGAGNANQVVFRYSRGTTASPTDAVDTDQVFSLKAQYYAGGAYRDSAAIFAYATATPSGTSSPGKLSFLVTPTGSTSGVERFYIDDTEAWFKSSLSGNHLIHTQNTSASGYSGLYMYNSSSTKSGYVGIGNSSASVFANNFYVGTASTDPLLFVMGGTGRWTITTGGNLDPVADATYAIGSTTAKPTSVWSQIFNTRTTSGYGVQTSTFSADENLNFYLQSFSSTSANDRGSFQMYRARGSSASPSAVVNGDRLGVIAWQGAYTTSGSSATYGAAALIQAVVSGTVNTAGYVPTELQFKNMDLTGTLNTNLTLLYDGTAVAKTIRPASDLSYNLGSASYRYNAGYISVLNGASVYADTTLSVFVGGYARVDLQYNEIRLRDSFGVTTATWNNVSGDLYTAGYIDSVNGFKANGTAGQTATVTVRDAAGTGTCTLVFTGGIKTGGTC